MGLREGLYCDWERPVRGSGKWAPASWQLLSLATHPTSGLHGSATRIKRQVQLGGAAAMRLINQLAVIRLSRTCCPQCENSGKCAAFPAPIRAYDEREPAKGERRVSESLEILEFD